MLDQIRICGEGGYFTRKEGDEEEAKAREEEGGEGEERRQRRKSGPEIGGGGLPPPPDICVNWPPNPRYMGYESPFVRDSKIIPHILLLLIPRL